MVLAVELVTSGLVGQTGRYAIPVGQPEVIAQTKGWPPLRRPALDPAAYLTPGPIEDVLREEGGRYVSIDPRARESARGLLFAQTPQDWPLYANQRGELFGLPTAQGYNPLQLLRYWRLSRAAEPSKREHYNAAFFVGDSTEALDLLGVRWIVAPAGSAPELEARSVAREGRYELFRRAGTVPFASQVEVWRVVHGEVEALDAVTGPGFDPNVEAVLEQDPGVASARGPAEPMAGPVPNAIPLGHQGVQLQVVTDRPVVLVVRIPFERNWHATVDGRPVSILRADHVLQAVVVPTGTHTVVFAYDDPWVGLGILGSALVLCLAGAAAFVLERRGRSHGRPSKGHGTIAVDAGHGDSGDQGEAR
jgi:hypothetical protein